MPIPRPSTNEKEDEFINRCMGNDTMNKDYPDNKQRSGVCYTSWREAKKDAEEFIPPESGDAPQEVKDILAAAYSSCRLKWTKDHPADKENQGNKTSCSQQAWGAVKNAGWNKISGKWIKKDSIDLKTDRTELKAVQLENGFLKAKISIARPGVFKYLYDQETRMEAKLPEDLFSSFTLDSAKAGIPVTDDHPEENGEYVLVDSSNYYKFIKGNISNVKIENNEITGDVLVYDADLIERIMDKKQNEVSIGFSALCVPENGFYGKEQYNIRQKNISINHAAMVTHGRAGESIKIHIDRRQIMPNKWTVEGGDASNLLTYRLYDNSGDIQVSPEIHTELMKIKTDAKEREAEIKTLKEEKANLENSIKADKNESEEIKKLKTDLETSKDSIKEWQKKCDELQKEIPVKVEKEASEKVRLIEFAKSVDVKADGLSNREIKLQVISKGLPYKEGVKIDELSDDAVDARYDAACELLRHIPNNETKKTTETVKVDADSIAKKREALLNVYDNKKKEA